MAVINTAEWWAGEDVIAVVTGGNRGIGLEIVRQLAEKGVKRVVLTARDPEKGEAAAEKLRKEGMENVVFHKLDVTDTKSAQDLAAWIKEEYGGVDILINNAAIISLFYEDKRKGAKDVIETNYYGVKKVIEAFLPIFKESKAHGRIINVSSRLGRLELLKNEQLKDSICDQMLTEYDIDSLIDKFLVDVNNNQVQKNGWPLFNLEGRGIEAYSDYCVSKLALNTYTRAIFARLLGEKDGKKIYINVMCPGYTRTDMTLDIGDKTVKEGADTAVWLALLHPSELSSGKFYGERVEIPF